MISVYHPFSFTFLWATISTVISYYSGAMESVSDLMGLKGADLGKYEKKCYNQQLLNVNHSCHYTSFKF